MILGSMQLTIVYAPEFEECGRSHASSTGPQLAVPGTRPILRGAAEGRAYGPSRRSGQAGMYLENWGVLFKSLRDTRKASVVTANVVFLGVTSLVTDISSEMVSATLPLYLVFGLSLSPLQFGLVDGLYQGIAAFVRIGSGMLADRGAFHKQVAMAGYGLSAVCKLAFLPVGAAWGGIVAIILIDRTGKGIRTSPRDALISLSTPPEGLATAFGVHRALDTVGAMLGPLLAFALVSGLVNGYRAVFVVSFCFAIVGFAVLALLVENRQEVASGGPPASFGNVGGLLRVPAFRALLLAGGLLGIATISDAFVYLAAQERIDFSARFIPLLFVGTAIAYLVLAVPAGWLADRVGREAVFLGGYALLLPLYVLLGVSSLSSVGLVVILGLLGAFYAATDGVLMALTSAIVPASLRGSGIGLVTATTSLARLAASLVFGGIWTVVHLDAALVVFGVALAGGLAVATFMLGRPRGSVGGADA